MKSIDGRERSAACGMIECYRRASSELDTGVVGTQEVNGYKKETLAKRLLWAVDHDVLAILEIGNP